MTSYHDEHENLSVSAPSKNAQADFYTTVSRMPTYLIRQTFGMTGAQFSYMVACLNSWGWRNDHDANGQNPRLFKRAIHKAGQNRP